MLLNFGGITRYNGVMDIQQKLKNLPELPVYRLDQNVGKLPGCHNRICRIELS